MCLLSPSGALPFSGNNLRNSAGYALDQYLNTNTKLNLANQMVPSAGTQDNHKCPRYGSHVELSQHLLSYGSMSQAKKENTADRCKDISRCRLGIAV